ncbi:MAG: CinA family protein [Alphaproteobacteria bacterium]|nr:CinA family protein [Alphaproteobacteria bacterium]
MLPSQIHDYAKQLITSFTQKNLRIVTAESCTGGLIAAALTDVPGASAVVERGFVTYSNEAKVDVLGVLPEILNRYGAVSKQVAEEMAQGALAFSHADVAVSVTGIAGPDGGTDKKPVGLVFFGLATKQGALMHYKCQFSGNRDEIRLQAVAEALRLVLPVAE